MHTDNHGLIMIRQHSVSNRHCRW